jgi:hypothetical protein
MMIALFFQSLVFLGFSTSAHAVEVSLPAPTVTVNPREWIAQGHERTRADLSTVTLSSARAGSSVMHLSATRSALDSDTLVIRPRIQATHSDGICRVMISTPSTLWRLIFKSPRVEITFVTEATVSECGSPRFIEHAMNEELAGLAQVRFPRSTAGISVDPAPRPGRLVP